MIAHVLLITALMLGQVAPPDAADRIAGLQSEVGALLTPAGQLDDAQQANRLATLAAQCVRAADGVEDGRLQLQARLAGAQAYNALAQQAIADGRASLASLRLVQLRSSAHALERTPTGEAGLVSGYWLLMADLIESNRNARTLAERQIGAAAQMARFLSMHRDAPPSPIVRQVELALARLYDQVGENELAMRLAGELRGVLSQEQFAAMAANAQLVGEPVASGLRGEDGPVVLAIGVDEEPVVDADVPVRRVETDASLPLGLGELFPRYVLVDAEGVIRAVGHSPAVAYRGAALMSEAGGEAPEAVQTGADSLE